MTLIFVEFTVYHERGTLNNPTAGDHRKGFLWKWCLGRSQKVVGTERGKPVPWTPFRGGTNGQPRAPCRRSYDRMDAHEGTSAVVLSTFACLGTFLKSISPTSVALGHTSGNTSYLGNSNINSKEKKESWLREWGLLVLTRAVCGSEGIVFLNLPHTDWPCLLSHVPTLFPTWWDQG